MKESLATWIKEETKMTAVKLMLVQTWCLPTPSHPSPFLLSSWPYVTRHANENWKRCNNIFDCQHFWG